MSTDDKHPCENQVWEGRAILHVDLDAFFAAVEQLDHPELRGKPVIVGGDPGKRGVVSTCSYEARTFGVRSAMPSARAAQLCPDAIWVHGSYGRYREMSQAVFAIFRDESPLVQPLSVDEAFLDVTPSAHSTEHPIAIARRIRARIAELGITGSVGVATSKTVAKIASDYDKPDGLTVVCPGTEAEFLAPLPVRDMSGVGPKTAEHLATLGIRTLGDLAALDSDTARAVLGAHGESLVLRSRGIDPRPVHPNDPAKQVSNERTFSTDVRNAEEIAAVLSQLCEKVGRRLRAKGMAGCTVTIKIRFSDFSTRTVQRTLPAPTDDELVFGPVALELVMGVWTRGVGVRLLGVGLSGFQESAEQLTFDATDAQTPTPAATPRARKARAGIDAVREKFGDEAVVYGRDLLHPKNKRRIDGSPDHDS